MRTIRIEFEVSDMRYDEIKTLSLHDYLDILVTGTYDRARVDFILRYGDNRPERQICKCDADIRIMPEDY